MDEEMDILKEVGMIAAAHGSIALSQILKTKIELSVPTTTIISGNSMRGRINLHKIGVAVSSRIATGMSGKVIFLLDEKNAYRLNDLSYRIQMDESMPMSLRTELGMSLIKEIGSMVSSAYVTAIGMMFDAVILLDPPSLVSGTIEDVLNVTVFSSLSSAQEEVLLIDAEFCDSVHHLDGSFYLVLTADAAGEIRNVCRQRYHFD
ncbi:MAG: chemotaxis protein CheC [Candidatus Omnitrophica bacterium]|nr:chemotaxis protein CheC [Candidatus Omnitrophota bacterium]